MAAELALAALGARTVLATAMLCMSEPDASALLGVSEGDAKASTISRCRVLVAWMQAEGPDPGCVLEGLAADLESAPLHPSYESEPRVAIAAVLTLGPVESAEQRSELGESARSDDGED
ncbi:hypothetical protein, partial [Niveibacterium sp.]|uniref:hypothetical protein n=1 Tax=Niveibacterium sp. TaxID=2017444 RepID=UPI0035B1923A